MNPYFGGHAISYVCYSEAMSLSKPQVVCVYACENLRVCASLCACQFVCVWCTIVVIMLAVGSRGVCEAVCVSQNKGQQSNNNIIKGFCVGRAEGKTVSAVIEYLSL